MSDANEELLTLTQELLNCIEAGDWETYQELSDASLTAFEPEARGHLVEGLDFHHFYFQLNQEKSPQNTTIVAPSIRVFGKVGIVAYIRLIQYVDASGVSLTQAFEETRIWHRQNGQWRQVHFHRS